MNKHHLQRTSLTEICLRFVKTKILINTRNITEPFSHEVKSFKTAHCLKMWQINCIMPEST